MSHHLCQLVARFMLPVVVVAASAALPRAADAQDALSATSAVHVRDQYIADLDTLHARFMAYARSNGVKPAWSK